jgi:hypothetical protein
MEKETICLATLQLIKSINACMQKMTSTQNNPMGCTKVLPHRVMSELFKAYILYSQYDSFVKVPKEQTVSYVLSGDYDVMMVYLNGYGFSEEALLLDKVLYSDLGKFLSLRPFKGKI